MPLDVVRLRDSDIAAVSSGDEFRCAVLLWCASWHQVPAGSLPDDDIVLSQYAGFGRVVKEWKKVRPGALRGWVKCQDGRLYHPVVSEKANEAWQGRVKYREKKEAERLRKAQEREAKKLADAGRKPDECPEDKDDLSDGQNPNVQRTDVGNPAENALTVDSGQWIGTVDSRQLTTKPETPSRASTVVGVNEIGDDQPPARSVQIAILLRAKGIDATSQNPLVCLTWANNPKVTDEVLELAVEKAKRAKPNERIPVRYLENIVEREINPPEPKPKADNWAWKRSESGIDKMGRSLGMMARTGESYRDYADRIEAELQKRQGGKAA
jgi:hypothetical protein